MVHLSFSLVNLPLGSFLSETWGRNNTAPRCPSSGGVPSLDETKGVRGTGAWDVIKATSWP